MLIVQANSKCPNCGTPTLVDVSKVEDFFKVATFCGKCRFEFTTSAKPTREFKMDDSTFVKWISQFESLADQEIRQSAEISKLNAVKH